MKWLLAAVALAPVLALAQTADVLDPDVRQETIGATICTSGYTKSIRPAVSYTNGVKRKLMREQGIDPARIHEFELDHIIPLEVGGHPRNVHNLQLQPWPEARTKDRLENRLHRMVCKGRITLSDARACIWRDWQACAAKYRR